jgi:hypothetical protein
MGWVEQGMKYNEALEKALDKGGDSEHHLEARIRVLEFESLFNVSVSLFFIALFGINKIILA